MKVNQPPRPQCQPISGDDALVTKEQHGATCHTTTKVAGGEVEEP